MAKTKTTRSAPAKRSTTRQAQARGDQAPEAKATTKEKSAAAERLFKNADEAALRGLPESMTVDQHETQVRKAALGY